MKEETVEELSQQMSDLTAPMCAGESCRVPHSCCHKMYCEGAIQYAKEEWGVVLKPTGHPTLPLMGSTGCTAAPHLRPTCTVHTCSINGVGVVMDKDYKVDKVKTRNYFILREKIEMALYERELSRKTQASGAPTSTGSERTDG